METRFACRRVYFLHFFGKHVSVATLHRRRHRRHGHRRPVLVLASGLVTEASTVAVPVALAVAVSTVAPGGAEVRVKFAGAATLLYTYHGGRAKSSPFRSAAARRGLSCAIRISRTSGARRRFALTAKY